jgi:hypothetical protein
VAAGGALALVAGRRASAHDEPAARAAPAAAGRELRLFGRGSTAGAPGPAPGGAWVVRRCALLDAPDGRSIGEFVATSLAASASFGAAAAAAAPLEMQTFRLGEDTLFGIGAGGGRDGERAYAVIGGTGRFAGARGTVLEREHRSGAVHRGLEFVVTLVG